MSCLTKKAYGEQPGHAQFFYPKKYGYGELWLRMAEEIKGQIKYDASVHAIDFDTNTVTTKEGETYSADVIISTIPWMEFAKITGMPQELKEKNRTSEIQLCSDGVFPGQSGHRSTVGLLSGSGTVLS